MLASETRKLAREALAEKWGKAALITLVYTLLTWGINFVLNFIPFVGGIAQFVIQVPLTFGLIATLIKLKRGEETTYTEFLNNGFSNFASSWKVTLWTWVKLLAPIIITIVCIIAIVVGFAVAIAGTTYGETFVRASQTMSSEQLANYMQTVPMGNLNSTGVIIMVLGFIGAIASSIWYTIKSYLYKTTFFMLFDNPDKDAKSIVVESASMMKGNRWKFFCLELSFIGWGILASLTCGIGALWLMPYMMVAEVCFYEHLAGKSSEVKVEESKEGQE